MAVKSAHSCQVGVLRVFPQMAVKCLKRGVPVSNLANAACGLEQTVRDPGTDPGEDGGEEDGRGQSGMIAVNINQEKLGYAAVTNTPKFQRLITTHTKSAVGLGDSSPPPRLRVRICISQLHHFNMRPKQVPGRRTS